MVVVVVAGWMWRNSNNTNNNATSSLAEQVKTEVTEQLPFAEMTIPYLRSREYKSRLGELKAYKSTPTYDSYLTNYDSDGLKINGLLTIPKGSEPEGGHPGVVFVHGYIAPTAYKTTEKYQDYVDHLARNGFVVFKIDLRGHGESEGEPGGAYYSSDYVIDTLNARAALGASEFVNPNKIGLWGHSMAGNVTFRAFVVASDIPALVVWGGAGYSYSDLQKYGLNDNSYRPPTTSSQLQSRRAKIREKYGEFDPNSKFWSQVPATNYLDGVSGAVQLHHSVDDNVVDVGYSRDLMTILDKTNIPHQLYEYGSGGHNISGSSFSAAMKRTVEFYQSRFGE